MSLLVPPDAQHPALYLSELQSLETIKCEKRNFNLVGFEPLTSWSLDNSANFPRWSTNYLVGGSLCLRLLLDCKVVQMYLFGLLTRDNLTQEHKNVLTPVIAVHSLEKQQAPSIH